ncbi:MAG: helix-turn-helix domain-containing protein [Ruminococcus sp.]|uniref:helix-turn-helix domain-containing protein n=1 Tax=Ruminococcus sp. TaxID=41978 RepID=UPI0025EC87EE|nr:helix-turn-helix domain-containing protein [Ruminococcus sp.]MCR5541091.1 helix-turn-helix domain-containing protein [Ruminococcus sp.]
MAGENEQRFEHGFATFVTALDYIESHLCEDISQEDIAAACFVSLSSLQKVWRYCTHFSLKDYISKRRLTLAGRLLLTEEVSVLEVAMRFGYNSHEVFTRAFTKVWGIAPSKFKKQWKGDCGLYPPLNPEYIERNERMRVKKYDISEFYDYLRSQAGTFVLCFDIQNLMMINHDLGREAGDKAILEAFRRINEAAEENMICLRLGGDEFAMITESDDTEKVIALAEKVLSQNGCKVPYSGGEVSVSVRCGAIKIGEHLRYSVLCNDFNAVMEKARFSGRIEFM